MSEEKYRPLTSRLLFGRPKWKVLFDEIAKTNKQWVVWKRDAFIWPSFWVFYCYFLFFSKRVGVFCCGPKGISRSLHRLCNSTPSPGITFEFNKESFSWLPDNRKTDITLREDCVCLFFFVLLWGSFLIFSFISVGSANPVSYLICYVISNYSDSLSQMSLDTFKSGPKKKKKKLHIFNRLH